MVQSFQGVNGLFVLSFENNGCRRSYTRHYLPLVEIKDYNVMIDGRDFFDQPVKNDLITYDNIRKIVTGCLLDYLYFKNYYKIIAIDLSKQKALDADPKAIVQISFTANLDQDGNPTMFSIIEEAKKTISDFSQVTVKILKMSSYDLATTCSIILFCCNIISI